MKISRYRSKTFQIIIWSTSVAMFCYLVAICFAVFHVNLGLVNSLMETAVQRVQWQQLREIAPHLIYAPFWIPYWCATVLLFLYKERVRFMFWLNRFSLFGLILTACLFVMNQLLRLFWPQLCGRSTNFLHSYPYEGCQLLFVTGGVVTGMCLLSIFCLRSRHWMVKLMLAICSVSLILAALLQESFFPLQLLIAVGLSAIAAVIGYIKITLANQERFPELHNFLQS